jgi:hypothetical protein
LMTIKQFDQISWCHDLFAEQLLGCLTQGLQLGSTLRR